MKKILSSFVAVFCTFTAIQAATTTVPVTPDTVYRRVDDETVFGTYTCDEGSPMNIRQSEGRWIFKHATSDGVYLRFEFDRAYTFNRMIVQFATDDGTYPLRAAESLSVYSVTSAGTQLIDTWNFAGGNDNISAGPLKSTEYNTTSIILINLRGREDVINTEKFRTGIKQIVFSAECNHAITYYDDLNGNPIEKQYKFEGVDLTVSENIPTKDGYDFIGWGINSISFVTHQPGDTYSLDRGVDVNAWPIWREKTSVAETAEANTSVKASKGMVYGPEDMHIYDLSGREVTAQNGQLQGRYIVVCGKQSQVVVVEK